MLQPGQQIGRYVVVDRIGQGGTASVYRARHVDLGSMHALKRIGVRRPRLFERLLAEGRAQASLQHPNVVRVTDVLEHDDAPILVMEYVDGPSLDALVWRGPLELHQALTLAVGVTRGLRAAHALGLAHRDLKPANVLLEQTDGVVVPRIADFGLVKVFDDPLPRLAPTRAGAAMGTPEFMAPEQIRDASSVDLRADLYSLGCILHLMLTGRVPARATDLLVMYERMMAEAAPRPSRLAPGIPRALDDLVARLLAPDPTDRPQSAEAVLAVLESDAVRVPSGRCHVRPQHLLDTARCAPAAWTEVHGSPPDRARPLLAVPAEFAIVPLVGPLLLATVALALARQPQRPAEVGPIVSAVIVASEPHAARIAPERDFTVRPRRSRPPPTAPAGASVAVSGDARRVWLVRDGLRYDVPGSVPTGSYEVVALFPGSEPLAAGSLLVSTEPVTLRCHSFALRCTR